MKTRIMAALILLLAVFTVQPAVAFAATIDDKTSLSLEGGSSFAIEVGESMTVPLSIFNVGNYDANITEITAVSATMPTYVSFSPGTVKKGERMQLNLSVTAPSDDGAATHSVSLTVQYKTPSDKDASYSTALRFNAKAEATQSPPPSSSTTAKPNIVLTGPTSIIELNAGNSQNVTVGLRNAGNGTASGTTVTLKPNEKLNLSLSGNSGSLGSINAGGSKTVTVSIGAPSDLASGTYPVDLSFVYYDSNGAMLTGSATFHVKVNNPDKGDEKTPVIIIDGFSSSAQSVTPGGGFSVSMNVKNNSGVGAANVQLAVGDLPSGFGVQSGAGNTYFGAIENGKTQQASFSFTASEDVVTGSYPLKFILTYHDKDGKEYTGNYTYYISVAGKAGPASKGALQIVSITNPTGVYSPDIPVKFTVTMKNTGDNDLKNIKVSSILGESGLVPRSASIQQIPLLAPGASASVSFDVSATSSAKTQSYTVGFGFEFDTGAKDDAGKAIIENFSQYSSMSVSNPEADSEDDGKKSVPKIIVSEYSVDPIIVMAGQEFDLDIKFKNTHATKAVTNIKVSLSVESDSTEKKGSVFTPVNASNTLYIERIDPHAEISHHLRMYTIPDAAPKNYIIMITFEYEDEAGNALTGTEQIGVNVKQVTKLELGDVFLPSDAMVGDTLYISFTVHNTGKVTLNNLKVKFEGENFNTSSSEIIFGNFASGSYEYYDASIAATAPGEQTVKMIASYDDDTGEHKEIVREYTINVMEQPPMDPGMMGPDGSMGMDPNVQYDPVTGLPIEASTGFLGFLKTHWIWFTVGGVVVIGAVITIIVLRRRKKQRSFDLDE